MKVNKNGKTTYVESEIDLIIEETGFRSISLALHNNHSE